jgi:hypothetical protein
MEKELINDLIKAGYAGEMTSEALVAAFAPNILWLTVSPDSPRYTVHTVVKSFVVVKERSDSLFEALAKVYIGQKEKLNDGLFYVVSV